jgi:uncharacterized protein (DUF1778 family)
MPRPDLGRVPFRLRLSADTIAVLERAAAESEQSVQDFVRDILDGEAKQLADRPTAAEIYEAHRPRQYVNVAAPSHEPLLRVMTDADRAAGRQPDRPLPR